MRVVDARKSPLGLDRMALVPIKGNEMFSADIKIVCGNTQVSAKCKPQQREALTDKLYSIGVDYINRPNNHIDVIIDDASASCLSQVMRWLEKATT